MPAAVRKNKDNLITRLNRIEGQIRGIKNMIEEEKCCVDVLVQVNAAKSALNSVGVMLLETHIRDCVEDAVEKGQCAEIIEQLTEVMKKYIK